LATRSNLVRASGLQPERDFSQTGLSRPCLAIPTIPACPLNGRNLKLVVKKERAFARVVPKNFPNSFAPMLFICLDQLNTDYHYFRNLSRHFLQSSLEKLHKPFYSSVRVFVYHKV